ncbi:hypothetical protein J565_4025 [Acinetobacter baumannii 1552818]|nr:hypothetical protein J565_4025 [Acinetobacter baumannii 1552818]
MLAGCLQRKRTICSTNYQIAFKPPRYKIAIHNRKQKTGKNKIKK